MNAHADLAAFPIYKFGTDQQMERYLPCSIAGEIIGAYAITEPNTGSDAAGLATRADKKNGGYVINGRKNFITNGTIFSSFRVTSKPGVSRSTMNTLIPSPRVLLSV